MYPPSRFVIQTRNDVDDGIGGIEEGWDYYLEVDGYLDMMTGSDLPAGNKNSAFVEESTHVLIIPDIPPEALDDTMLVVGSDGRTYDITYVDNPVGVDHHLEVYLRYRRV